MKNVIWAGYYRPQFKANNETKLNWNEVMPGLED